jgi:acyl-CoA reductase-like NAD-dependent aldehyde dehydrogenase
VHRSENGSNGSTTRAVEKIINRDATETMKRVTLELDGKSPTVIMADAGMQAFTELRAVFG